MVRTFSHDTEVRRVTTVCCNHGRTSFERRNMSSNGWKPSLCRILCCCGFDSEPLWRRDENEDWLESRTDCSTAGFNTIIHPFYYAELRSFSFSYPASVLDRARPWHLLNTGNDGESAERNTNTDNLCEQSRSSVRRFVMNRRALLIIYFIKKNIIFSETTSNTIYIDAFFPPLNSLTMVQ